MPSDEIRAVIERLYADLDRIDHLDGAVSMPLKIVLDFAAAKLAGPANCPSCDSSSRSVRMFVHFDDDISPCTNEWHAAARIVQPGMVAVPVETMAAVEALAKTMRAGGWTDIDGLMIGIPGEEVPAVLIERDLFDEFIRRLASPHDRG